MSGPPTWQLATAVYVPLLTGNLSVIGSGLIIYSMLVHGRRTKLQKPHHRILLAMSIYDLFYSLVKAYTFLLTPAAGQPGAMGVPGAMGNMATCRLQGFFIETAHATGAYNSLLSIYFWLSICRGIKNDTFTKYEPIAHVLIFVVFVGFAIAGVVVELFNPAFGFCFIASYPPGCESGPGAPVCERWPPRTMGLMYEIFAQMWVQAYIVIVVVTNAAIWYKVHKQEKAIRKINQRSLNNNMERGLSQRKKETNRERMVAVQSTLYVVAFIACWIGPTAFHLADWIAGFKSFWAVLVIVIFTPLQGFWNAFVYARPTYIRLRRKNPDLDRLQTVKLIFFTPDPMAVAAASIFSSRSPVSAAAVPSTQPSNRLVDDDSFAEDGEAEKDASPAPLAAEEENLESHIKDMPPDCSGIGEGGRLHNDEYIDNI